MVGITAALRGSLEKDLKREGRLARRAVREGIKEETARLKGELRDQTEAARLGRRLRNSWRSRFFRNRGLDAAGMVWTRAWYILGNFEKGAMIRARRRKYMLIPTGFNRRGGRRGAKVLVTPGQMARVRKGSFVKKSRDGALLWWMRVARASRLRETRRQGVPQFHRTGITDVYVNDKRIRDRRRRDMAAKYGALPMFVLVPQVKIQKRLNVERAGREAFLRLPATITRHWRERP